MSGSSVLQGVLASTVRTDLLLAVADEARTTEELKADVDASESAVYDALGNLERQRLVTSAPDGWTTTGTGRLVADLLVQQENLSRLFEQGYWERHDVEMLPRRFRLRLTELANADVFRAPDTNPHAVVREVCERVEADGPNVDIVTPIYQAEYEDVMPDHESARLLIDTTVAEQALERTDDVEQARTYEKTQIRILDIDVGIGVTGDHLMLSLPTLDGQYDSRTEVFATDDRALDWGRDLFEYYWERATPEEQFLANYFG
jgi:predicted transcriptional regulator